jgi:23S rRNA (cytidine1920-2'-O)/16S rRNA (cytidine1409-2'-O)-methyltransferase
VGRGGLKLEAALAAFAVDPGGRTCLDVGASTGGFTDCLLQHGAARVYALDVGHGQLAWTIRQDPRVVVMEHFNARHLTPDDLAERPSLAVADVSFISLTLVLPAVAAVLSDGGVIVSLIKPQFELSRGEVGRGGIVRDPEAHERAVGKIRDFAAGRGWHWSGCIPSPITGADGNREFLCLLAP